MSWVEKLPNGRHRAVYRDPDGRRLSKTFDRKADAKKWIAAADTDQARGQWVDPRGGAMLLADWAALWFAARTVRPTTSASDLSRYRNHLLPAFGEVPLKDLSPLRIRAFVAELSARRAPATVRHAHALLSTLLSDAVTEGLLLSNPCRTTSLPQAPRLRRGVPVPHSARGADGGRRPGLPLPGPDRRASGRLAAAGRGRVAAQRLGGPSATAPVASSVLMTLPGPVPCRVNRSTADARALPRTRSSSVDRFPDQDRRRRIR